MPTTPATKKSPAAAGAERSIGRPARDTRSLRLDGRGFGQPPPPARRALQVAWRESGASRDAGKHAWPDLVDIVNATTKSGQPCPRQNAMRPCSTLHRPVDAQECGKNEPSPGG